ncbi:MAG: M10 family metallopeptidase C-terminal domain-containing protein, partial [Proteobacteria bacterium]|nr:M10 family metallopeptidase C-terminal domain-containing protein [Pseudomonadota bacterium]
MSDEQIFQADDARTGLTGCGCPICAGGGTDASLDGQAGTTLNNKTIWSADQVAAHLNRTGLSWNQGASTNARQQGDADPNTIAFGFFNTQEEVGANGYLYRTDQTHGLREYFNFAPFSEAQRAATREAMQAWDDVIAPSFRETSAGDADINFGNLASAPSTQAYARLPSSTMSSNADINSQIREIAGDVWVSASQTSNFQLDEGNYGAQTLVHEVGHALGLSHPGAYNAGSGGTITYKDNAEYAQDTRAYTVMSYFNGSSIPGTRHFDFNISSTVFAATPLIHDIAAAQRIYGADMTTRTGDTVYGFNSNAGRNSYDFTKTPAPIMAIWDAGGNDTIDASGYATTQLIDLTPGSLSSIGGVTFDTAPSFEQVNANRAGAGFAPIARTTYDNNMAALRADPVVGRLTDNVGIAYGVTIENARGGSGSDTIIGNAANNQLSGAAGADVLAGKEGNDLLDGGAGDDQLGGQEGDDFLLGGLGADHLNGEAGDDLMGGQEDNDFLLGGRGRDRLFGDAGDDIIGGQEDDDVINGGSGRDLLYGDAGNDRLLGGADDDRLLAGDGDDLLSGEDGDDRLEGGGGADRLEGGVGRDELHGQDGDDLIGGQEGDDFVLG